MSKFLLSVLVSVNFLSMSASAMPQDPESTPPSTVKPAPEERSSAIEFLTPDLFRHLRNHLRNGLSKNLYTKNDRVTGSFMAQGNHHFHKLMTDTQEFVCLSCSPCQYNFIEDRENRENFKSFWNLERFPNLQCLYIDGPWGAIDLPLFKRISKLSLRGNDSNVNKSLSRLTTLTTLNLTDNKQIMDEDLYLLTKLTTLNLVFNKQITDEVLTLLTNLTKLDLNLNPNITNKGLYLLTNLINLSLKRDSSITDEGLRPLTNLTKLDLENNSNITDEGIGSLIKLETLSLNREITKDGLDLLPALKNLTLNFNQNITDKNLGSLTNLTTLNLSLGGDLTIIPHSLVHLRKLTCHTRYITPTLFKSWENLLSLETLMVWGLQDLMDDSQVEALKNRRIDVQQNESLSGW